MAREEQIRNAAAEYATHLVETDITDFHGKYEKKMDFVLPEYNAFLAGVEWVDANPKSQWISVDNDLPCNHKELIENEHYTKKVLVVLEWGDNPIEKLISICDMCNVIGPYNVDWYWRDSAYYHVILWSPLPELPKE